MTIRLYLTIAAVVAILYALAFLLIPVTALLFFSDFAEPRAVLYLRFCGAAILAWGLIEWFATDFQDLVRRSQHSDWQHCRPRREHHHYRFVPPWQDGSTPTLGEAQSCW